MAPASHRAPLRPPPRIARLGPRHRVDAVLPQATWHRFSVGARHAVPGAAFLYCATSATTRGHRIAANFSYNLNLSLSSGCDGQSIWKERLQCKANRFFEPSSKRRKGFPSETNVKRGFPRRAWRQGTRRKAGQKRPLPVRFRTQVSKSAVCDWATMTAQDATNTSGNR